MTNENKGYSLVELLVVISFMGILAAISVPGLLEWRRDAQYKEAAQLAASALRQAKGQAINVNQQVTVTFTLDDTAANENNSVKIGTGVPVLFKKGIEIKKTADCNVDSGTVSIVFNPGGSSETGYVCIFDGATKKYRIGIPTAHTGRVRLQKWQGGTWK